MWRMNVLWPAWFVRTRMWIARQPPWAIRTALIAAAVVLLTVLAFLVLLFLSALIVGVLVLLILSLLWALIRLPARLWRRWHPPDDGRRNVQIVPPSPPFDELQNP